MTDGAALLARRRHRTVSRREEIGSQTHPASMHPPWRSLGLLPLLACGTGPEDPPPLPAGAVRFAPESVYSGYWAEMEACSGLRGSLAAITWYYVPGFDPFPAPGLDKPVLGYWLGADNRIVLLQYVADPPALIRHEMLHALLRSPKHPPRYFEERCGETIAGPPLPPD